MSMESPTKSLSGPVVSLCRKRKPPRYWTEETNLISELRHFIHEQQMSSTQMPTASQLRVACRLDIINAIQRHGGFARMAARVGLSSSRRSRTVTSTDEYKAMALSEIETAINALSFKGHVPFGDMPTASKLRCLGEIALLNRIVAVGGFCYVASALCLRSARRRPINFPEDRPLRRPSHHWQFWRTVEAELRGFARNVCDGHMPRQKELIEAGRCDLLNAIQQHGGLSHAARRIGLEPAPQAPTKRPRGYWVDPAVLHGEVLMFTTRYGHPGLMPRRDQLVRAGRADLAYAIERHGGFASVAAAVHLVWHGPCTFWRVFRNLQRRLVAFIGAHGAPGVIPNIETLHRHRRLDLVYGIALHGGVMAVAMRMGLKVVYPRNDSHFWQSVTNVQRELEAVIKIQPLESHRYMPSSIHLVQLGRADLASGIRDHGGWIYYGQRLGLRFAFDVRAQGFWRKESNVYSELINYVNARYGTWEYPGKPIESLSGSKVKNPYNRHVPSSEMLKRDGRSDIAFAIETFHGGMALFAHRNSLTVAEDVVEFKPVEYLQNWVKYKAAIERWIDMHGSQGTMPTSQEMITSGRHDLRCATFKHGGFETVTRRLELVSAKGPVNEWLPKWLGLYAGKMGVLMQLQEKKTLSQRDSKLMRSLETVLSGNGVGKVRSLISKGEMVFIKKSQAGRNRRARLRDLFFERKGQNAKKLSKMELDNLRKRYRHLAPDDLISI